MRNVKLLALIFGLLGTLAAQADVPRMLGVQVTLLGRGGALPKEIDRDAYRQALRLAGALVQYEVADKFVVYEHGRAGGSRFCIEVNPSQPDNKPQQIVRGFMRLSPDRATTSFSVYQVEKCRVQ